MSDRSLIRAEERQLDLIPSSELDGVNFSAAETEDRAIYTGERLFRRRPEVYRAICSLLGEGVPFRLISRLLNVHHYTIQAVAEREPALIEAEKERIGRMARTGARICIERLVEVMPELEISDLGDAQRVAVIAGILAEKGELLTGGATARVDHGGESLVDLKRAIAALPADPAPVEGEFTEQTDFRGGVCGAKREAEPTADERSAENESTEVGPEAAQNGEEEEHAT